MFQFDIARFIVPEDKVPEFEDAWHQREEVMQQSAGFLGFSLERKDDSDFVATSKYAHTVLSAFASPARFALHSSPTGFSIR
jgi:heme-degrading monooxygenase HmoA